MHRVFKRHLFTVANKYFNNLNQFKPDDTFPNNNKLFTRISMTIEKLFENNYDNMTQLHRWCNTTSPKYKDTCDWEKKLDNAGRDNCYSKYY
mgnify:CR=1 FL=1|uniref:Uncharacterized protein n=1 Tax=viral metagenome TaxID=1070528 RepID=A0A6C0AZ26_9ZZZZ|tara:strand:- start:272 stop:547 length:276 start_codon:yes stop_codon:yes gene_type:complete